MTGNVKKDVRWYKAVVSILFWLMPIYAQQVTYWAVKMFPCQIISFEKNFPWTNVKLFSILKMQDLRKVKNCQALLCFFFPSHYSSPKPYIFSLLSGTWHFHEYIGTVHHKLISPLGNTTLIFFQLYRNPDGWLYTSVYLRFQYFHSIYITLKLWDL